MSKDGYYWVDNNCTLTMPFICAKPKSDPKTNRWIGLSDRGALNTFSWSDESYVSFTNWGAGYPNTHGGKSKVFNQSESSDQLLGQGDVCVYMDSVTGGWIHTFCHEELQAVCKTNQEITSVPPDHDGCTLDQVAYGASCYQIITDHK